MSDSTQLPEPVSASWLDAIGLDYTEHRNNVGYHRLARGLGIRIRSNGDLQLIYAGGKSGLLVLARKLPDRQVDVLALCRGLGVPVTIPEPTPL